MSIKSFNSNYKSYLNERTFTDIFEGKTVIPESPVQPRDCFVVCKELKEQCNIEGFEIVTLEGVESKDREVDCVVLASGPGYRVRNGVYPYHCDGMLVPNEVTRGSIVRFLERAANPFRYKGELYYLIEEHKLYFAIEP
jgi:hypothetical protein